MANIQRHFSSIANMYRHLRTTDGGPIRFIQQHLDPQPRLRAADVGCGTGRYSLMLCEHLGPKLFLYCIDGNREMLRQLCRTLRGRSVENFEPVHGFGRCLPLQDNSLDFISTFNAIHHFKVADFLREACRVVKPAGRVFVYTRTRSQNARNIWGRYFPSFSSKETRLFKQDELTGLVETIANLELETIETFQYAREDALNNLIHKARCHHYSTFCLYSEQELEEALYLFESHLRRAFKDTRRITWSDENTLFVLKKRMRAAENLPEFRAAHESWRRPAAARAPLSSPRRTQPKSLPPPSPHR